MKRTAGFTVIELVVVILFLALVTTVLFIQKNNLAATQRDSQRKTAINAMYYNLEEVFFEQNGYYPSKIDSKTLRAMDPNLFTDPDNIKMDDTGSSYRYEGTNCDNTACKSYTLRADLEKEADYIKTNRNST
jgi:type II secretory pathway pseudopilin PulG